MKHLYIEQVGDIEAEFRPRERMKMHGAKNLKDRELLAIILQNGTRGYPLEKLTQEVQSILDVEGVDVDPEKFEAIKGLGPAKSLSICASLELWRRLALPSRVKIKNPVDALPYLARFIDRKTEHFVCLCLNGAHEIMKLSVISVGTLNRTLVHPREVFNVAIEAHSAAIIVAHNHPSGHYDPSPEDNEVTKRLFEVSKILGIPILDHLIIAERGYYSYAEHGFIKN